MILLFSFVIVVANWRLDNAKSPTAMLQEKTARKPQTLRVADVVRTYIPQVGYLFSCFDTWYALCLYSYVRKRKHSTAQQFTAKTMNMKPKISERKIPVPSCVIIFCLIGTTYTRSERRKEKKRTEELLSHSLVGRPPLSLPSRNRFGPGKAFLPLCHSEPHRSPHVKPVAYRGPRSPARQS